MSFFKPQFKPTVLRLGVEFAPPSSIVIPMKYISPLTDFGFEKLFGSEESKALLISFLNDLLELPNFTKTESELVTHLDKMLYFIKNLDGLDSIPEMFSGDDEIQQGFAIAELAQMIPFNNRPITKALNTTATIPIPLIFRLAKEKLKV